MCKYNLVPMVLLMGLFLVPYFSLAQEGLSEQQFFVDGLCGMCKDRIEGAAIEVKGVKFC